MDALTFPIVLLAGVVSFASPCFLPVVPVFVGYLVGSGEPDTAGSADAPRGGVAAPPRASRTTAAAQAVVFVLGFTAVVVALWASLGVIGYALGEHRDTLRVLGGAVLVVMGLHVAGLIELSVLYRRAGPRMSATPHPTPSYRRSALLGLAFGAGWSPCIGPILGAVLGLAASGDSVGRGTLLLLMYCVGLGAPFVLVAVGATDLARRLGALRRHHTAVALASGAFIAVTGFLMITDVLGRVTGHLPTLGL